jgi:hypothetical protein
MSTPARTAAYATVGVIVSYYKVIIVAALAVLALVLIVKAAEPEYSDAEQGLITYSNSVGIRPLGEDGGAETILNIANSMCTDPDDLAGQMMPVVAWGSTDGRAVAFSDYVYGQYCYVR